jgi:hypothetical protein
MSLSKVKLEKNKNENTVNVLQVDNKDEKKFSDNDRKQFTEEIEKEFKFNTDKINLLKSW